MKKLVYAKFNTLRKPDFRLATFIRETADSKEVVKHPICKDAVSQIETLQSAYDSLKGYYNNIRLLKGKRSGDDLIFPFIDGEPLLPKIDLDNSSLSTVKDILKEAMDIIFDINEDFITSFLPTDGFKRVFSKASLETIKQLMDKTGRNVKALRVSNPDCIFDNFIKSGNDVYCLDYEWIFDFPVPLSYLKFRALYFFYQDNKDKLEDRIGCDDFLQMFGFGNIELTLFNDMEDSFQEYIFGKDRERLYLERYRASNSGYRNGVQSGAFSDRNSVLGTTFSDDNNTGENGSKQAGSIFPAFKPGAFKPGSFKPGNTGKGSISEGQSAGEADGKNAAARTAEKFAKGAEKQYLLGRSRIKNIFNKKVLTSEENVRYLERRMAELTEETEGNYDSWIRRCEEEFSRESTFSANPLISIVIYTDERTAGLDKSIEELYDISMRSFESSFYKNFEVTGVDSVKGDYVLFIPAGDTLSPRTLSEIVKRINEVPNVDMIYFDEDIVTESGRFDLGYMKPDWSVDFFYANGYIGDTAVFSRLIFRSIVKPATKESGSQWMYASVLKLSENNCRIEHIAGVLKHGAPKPAMTDDQIRETDRMRKYLLEQMLGRMGVAAFVEMNTDLVRGVDHFRINYRVSNDDSVSIIIPSKDNADMLLKHIGKIKETLSGNSENSSIDYEIIVVDNGSSSETKTRLESALKEENVTYIYEKMDFNFSRMCNKGASAGRGRYLLFLNDDIEVTDSSWMARMLGQAARKWTGAVGIKLLYPGTTLIQHDGIVNRRRDPVHIFSGMDDGPDLYHMRNCADVNVLAVTGACLMVSREKFEQVGGFNDDLPVAYNDVDLCMKLYEAGYVNVVRNDTFLYHHESLTRGSDASGEKYARLIKEKDKLYAAHPKFEKTDPFYSPYLTQTGVDCGYAFERFDRYEVTPLYKESGRGKTSFSDAVPDSKPSSGILREIDLVQVDYNVIIEGWAFRPGDIFNIDKEVSLLLVRTGDSGLAGTGTSSSVSVDGLEGYMITTTRKRRNDVVEAYPGESAIDFSGFIARIDRAQIASGRYDIEIIFDKKRYKTSRKLEA